MEILGSNAEIKQRNETFCSNRDVVYGGFVALLEQHEEEWKFQQSRSKNVIKILKTKNECLMNERRRRRENLMMTIDNGAEVAVDTLEKKIINSIQEKKRQIFRKYVWSTKFWFKLLKKNIENYSKFRNMFWYYQTVDSTKI